MTDARTVLTEGARILTDSGMAVVVAVLSVGVEIRDAFGVTATVAWVDLVDGAQRPRRRRGRAHRAAATVCGMGSTSTSATSPEIGWRSSRRS